MIEGRRADILRVLVEEHIHTGEPVSSRAIVQRSHLDVSTATVRNDLAVLEAEGLVVQPHTSAGRVPTATAYRFYVDHIGPAKLRSAAQAKVEHVFGDVHLELSQLLKATSDLLAEITDLPSVVIAPPVVGDRVRALHVVQVSADQLLIVLVTEGGRVLQQRCRVRVPVTPQEVDEAQTLVAGRAIGDELSGDITPEEAMLQQVSEPVREAIWSICDGIHLAGSASSEVFVAGAQRLAAVFEDIDTVRRVLAVLEREAEVLKIVASVGGTSVQLGSDLSFSESDVAVVSKSYDAGAGGGSVGVIGPMRMNYKRAISAVEEVSKELEDRIASTSDE